MVQKLANLETIALITFHMKVTIYNKNENGELKRQTNKYFERDMPYKVVAVHSDSIELQNGLYTVESGQPHYSLCYGSLVCNDRVPVCNRVGTILRYTTASTTFEVIELLDGAVGIGNNEFISLKQPVQFKPVK